MHRRWRGRVIAVGLAAALAVTAGCSGSDDEEPVSGGQRDASVCGYLYEWASTFRFPLQPDPHAAYTYVVPRITGADVGFEITGSFPYASWTEWMVYTGLGAGAQPFSLVKDSDIAPDPGSVNPFIPGTPVLSPDRSYRLLVVPHGTESSGIDESLLDVPKSNIMSSPKNGRSFVLANRVYSAFSGYNQGGAAGPTDTPFPKVRAVDLDTGEGVDCSRLNLIPNPKSPADMPTTEDSAAGVVALAGGDSFAGGPGAGSSGTGAEYAPALDPTLIEFTRPPLLPGADVSSIPPADDCAGYLGAATSTTQVGLIRVPDVPTWFATTDLDESSTFVQKEATYVSLTQYGASVNSYQPGEPTTASLANEELLVDSSGGSTVVVWPRSLSSDQQQQVVDLAGQQGWAVLQGGEQGDVTTANLFMRMKGTSPSYQGGFEPTSERTGVPCYFDDNPKATSWADVTGERYVASAQNVGGAAPQGVNCSLKAFLDGRCLKSLKDYIASTGGSYAG